MKKIIYIILLAISGSLAVSSCTENDSEPLPTPPASGGGGIDGKI